MQGAALWPFPATVVPPVTATLPARTSPISSAQIGQFQFPRPAATVIEAWSGPVTVNPLETSTAAPFVLAITQSGGAGAQGPYVTITCRTSVQVCLYGSSFGLSGFNLSTSANGVGARAYQVPSMLRTSNVLEVGFTLPGAGLSSTILIPNFATKFRFDVQEADKAAVYVQLISPATGTAMCRYSWAEQPSDGIPVGGAESILIYNGTGPARADFTLQV